MNQIPYGRQDINEWDIQEVLKVLHSDWLTQGPSIEQFERTVAAYCGAKYAVAVSSATAALHLACLAAGLREGDRLWTSPNTFVASANCARYCGAGVDFVDINEKNYNMDPACLADKLAKAQDDGQLPKVIVPVHFAGQSCDMEAIGVLAEKHGVIVIEDASHAIGGDYKGGKIGNCRYSDMTVFSFHPVKIVTTGEGGMVLTNRSELHQALLRLRSHGITRDVLQMQSESHGPWYYQQVELGFNYRITDLQAALGNSQMKRIDEFVARRRFLAGVYDQEFAGCSDIVRPWQDSDSASAWHLYVIQVPAAKRRAVFQFLRDHGIGVNVHYIPVHTQPYYKSLGFMEGDFPEAEKYYAGAISLPLYYSLKPEEQNFVIEKVKEALRR